MADRDWDRVYAVQGRRWGEAPGEAARIAAETLSGRGGLRLLDVGCGYGRDSVFLARTLSAAVVGIDPSREAIELARSAACRGLDLEFRTARIEDVHDGPYDAVLVSNVYHVMRPVVRAALRRRVAALLPPGGLLFLSTLAVGDPQHYGGGTPMVGDEQSFETATRYLHFSTAASLRREFAAFEVVRVYEHDFEEALTCGEAHRHRHVVFVGRLGQEARGRVSVVPEPVEAQRP